MTWILLAIAIALSVIISYQVISERQYTYVDKSGQQVKITGMEAIRADKKQMQPYEGAVTKEKLQNALKTCQDLYKKYGANIPQNVYYDKIDSNRYFLNMIGTVYPESGDEYEALSKVNPDSLSNFYQQRSEMLKSQLETQYPGNKKRIAGSSKLKLKSQNAFYSQRRIYK
jgi:hypothetical protein